jgi:hypothetical protein
MHDSGPDLLPAAHALVDEYCRYAVDRAWFYFPDALPPEVIAEKPRNGRIARNRSFPVEDLYVDGQQAGQVGQEIYGGGAAFIFASQAYHRLEGAPFELFCNSFVFGWDRPTTHSAIMRLAGAEANEAMLVLIPNKGARLDGISLTLGDDPQPKGRREGRNLVFRIPADSTVTLSW